MNWIYSPISIKSSWLCVNNECSYVTIQVIKLTNGRKKKSLLGSNPKVQIALKVIEDENYLYRTSSSQ